MHTPLPFRFNEGDVLLPAGYEDRTVNSFVPADPQRDPNLSIARDRLADGESLAAYVARQVAGLTKQLPGYKASAPVEALAGELRGLQVQASYRSGTATVHQRQAVFVASEGQALIFTLSSPRLIDASVDALWTTWLTSVRLGQD